MKKLFFILFLSCFVVQASQASTEKCKSTFGNALSYAIQSPDLTYFRKTVKVWFPRMHTQPVESFEERSIERRDELIGILHDSYIKGYDVKIIFDGTRLYLNSFLKIVFGGLILEGKRTGNKYLQKEYLDKHLTTINKGRYSVNEINSDEILAREYMEEAAKE